MPIRHHDGFGLNDALVITPSEDKHSFERARGRARRGVLGLAKA